MTKIRALNKSGIDKFHELIDFRRAGKDYGINQILSNPSYHESTPFKSEIDPKLKFEDRIELAKYLVGSLKEFGEHEDEYGLVNKDEYGKSAGLWSWFALVYFEQLFKPSNTDHQHYVLMPHTFRRYKHSVFTTFKTYKRFKDDARVFFSSEIDTWGQMAESTLSRDYLMNSEVAVKLINRLYADPENKGVAKKGASSQPSTKILKSGKLSKAGYGGIERFPRIIQRLKLTYHIQSLGSEEILDLMGNEFKKWVE